MSAHRNGSQQKWSAKFHCGYLNMPGLGRCPTGYECNVTAATREEAIELATVKAKEFDSRAVFVHITPLHLYAVKVKGKKDKRRREEFIVEVANEEEARRRVKNARLPNPSSLYRFAGGRPEIVGVRRV